MSKIFKGLLVLMLAAAVFSGSAEARGRGGGGGHGGGHGGWHGGGGYRGGGWGGGAYWGVSPFYSPYSYGPGYYGSERCGWARVRVLRNGRWVLRRSWRCW
jgi:hypothetical protein